MREPLIRDGRRYEFLGERRGYSIFEHYLPGKRNSQGKEIVVWNRTTLYVLDQGGEIIVYNSPTSRMGVTFRSIPASSLGLVATLFEGGSGPVAEAILKSLK